MDDPWGPSWATTDKLAAPSASPSKTILEPPPAAFLSTPNNLALPSAQSPWADDDAFGDWASPDPAKGTNASPWAWGNEVTPIEQLTPSYEPRPRRKSSTPKWPLSCSASPGLRAPTTPNSVSSGRLSPDPWASASSVTRDEPEPLAQLPQIPDVPSTVFENPTIELEPDTPKQIRNDEPDNAPDEIFALPFDEPKSEFTLESLKATQPANADVSIGKDDDRAHYSASATSGDDDEELPDTVHADSPITSIEDNPLPNSLQRKASSKVQSLVEMYDGISRRTTTTPERQPPPRRSASRDPDMSADDVSIDDAEKAERISGGPIKPQPVTEPAEETFDDRGGVAGEWKEIQRSTRPEHDAFVVDLTRLDTLIPKPEVERMDDAGDVSDRIISDSFTRISERKMWYRLSRHESLRKFNVGDDENYVRISWANSTMRKETMNIVRRWMEEDSMGGRAFRGGLARKAGGKFFGWDSTTESTPVDLDRVFGRKQKPQASVHRPTHSIHALPSLSTAPMVPSWKENTPASAQAKDSWGGFATFGWSTGADDKKATQEVKPAEPTTFAKPLPLGFAGFDNTPKSHTSLPAFTTSKPMVPTTPTIGTSAATEQVDEDDDEWGDMVSPTTAEATDSMSIPKTSWDSFSTNPLPDKPIAAASGDPLPPNPKPDSLGNRNKTTEENKSGSKDIGKVISTAPASTPSASPDVPQSQGGSIRPSESTYAFRPASSSKRPPIIPIAPKSTNPPAAPSPDGKSGVFAGGLLDTPLTTGLATPSTAQQRNSTEDSDSVQQIVRNLPDLSYMLK